MFRSGQSEYSINGDSCRLLDVQDLLSDSGLGREMHVIVGQGQLDQILHAGPEARRAIIEEAAGVLKHRKRKEKALRKLEAMQANLTRLVDLTAELNRRLKPLGRQAEVARRAATIQADLRDARLRLLADDYLGLRAKLEREAADEAAIRTRRALARGQPGAGPPAGGRARRRRVGAGGGARPGPADLVRALLADRAAALRRRAWPTSAPGCWRPTPSRSGRAATPTSSTGRPPSCARRRRGWPSGWPTGGEALAEAVAERTAVEGALAAAERRLADAARAAAGRAERLARLRGMVRRRPAAAAPPPARRSTG